MPGRLSYNREGRPWARGERVYRPLSELNRIKQAVAADRLLLISHKPEFQGKSMQDVVAGRADAELEKLRAALDAAIPDGTEFYLALYHEPENDTGSFSAETFCDATKRFVTRVTRKIPGAKSAVCMMREIYLEPARDMYNNPQPRKADMPYDPGSEFVDLYAGDPYNPWKLDPTYKFREFSFLTSPMVEYAAARGRPAGVWETGCQNDERKPQWILNAGTYAKTVGLPHISFFYGTGPRGTWDIEQGEGCAEAIDTLANRKYFGGPGKGAA